ncbi:hypothetical protein Pcac1_g7080 [Phytophthora cactorum]|uniref:Uncharacterized protein n=1 Tax=Phytophthora cactorum TaxID=29920 RepID=A0A8T1E2U3_9STRA|nr:hypothetical protein Pcac1_g7080 [Phytophthora cactorum]KAG2856989.1 hypothetical protein PC113_g11087 [Phytophthora cactorum]KAG2947727.1 hypothetical protein PC117_g6593 [Phytophthora cactorum]
MIFFDWERVRAFTLVTLKASSEVAGSGFFDTGKITGGTLTPIQLPGSIPTPVWLPVDSPTSVIVPVEASTLPLLVSVVGWTRRRRLHQQT